MFDQERIGHAAIEGGKGLHQVIAVNYGVVVGRGEVVHRSDPQVGPESELSFGQRDNVFNFFKRVGLENHAENRLQFGDTTAKHLKHAVRIEFGGLGGELVLQSTGGNLLRALGV